MYLTFSRFATPLKSHRRQINVKYYFPLWLSKNLVLSSIKTESLETYNMVQEGDCPSDDNVFRAFVHALYATVDAPVTWFRESVVEPNQKKYAWYHRQYRRVPTIDQCYSDDPVCDFEANSQFKRDRLVDSEILNILRMRYEDCMMYESPDHLTTCKPLWEKYKDAEEAWFIKYGDLGAYADARKAYMKQKHRMIWERRHGPLSNQTK